MLCKLNAFETYSVSLELRVYIMFLSSISLLPGPLDILSCVEYEKWLCVESTDYRLQDKLEPIRIILDSVSRMACNKNNT